MKRNKWTHHRQIHIRTVNSHYGHQVANPYESEGNATKYLLVDNLIQNSSPQTGLSLFVSRVFNHSIIDFLIFYIASVWISTFCDRQHEQTTERTSRTKQSHDPVTAAPPVVVHEPCGERSEHDGAHAWPGHTDARGQRQPGGEVLAHRHHGRHVDQTDTHTTEDAISDDEGGEAGGEAGGEDGQGRNQGAGYAGGTGPISNKVAISNNLFEKL